MLETCPQVFCFPKSGVNENGGNYKPRRMHRQCNFLSLSCTKPFKHAFTIINEASVCGKPESENATVFLAKRVVMVPGVPCIDRRNWGRETPRQALASIAYNSETVGPRVIFFKASQVSSCLKRSRGITTELIACGFCCYLIFRTLQ